MYEELVKTMRHCVATMDCLTCPVESIDKSAKAQKRCLTLVLAQAADAIEGLSMKLHGDEAAIAGMKREIERMVVSGNKPRWIPVTERLPEEYKDVLCYYEYFRYGDYNCMFRTIDRGYYGNGRWGGEAGQGHKNKVLAWMPLPEPPKEE